MRIVQNGTATQILPERPTSAASESEVRGTRLIRNRAAERSELPRKLRSPAAVKGRRVDPIARYHELVNREMSGKASPSELDELREIEVFLDEKDRQEMDTLEATVQKRHEVLMRQLTDLTGKLAALKPK